MNNNGLKAGATIGYDTTNAGGTVTISANLANSTGPGGGAVGFRAAGTGALELTGANNFSGQTIIEAAYGEVGMLQVSSFNSVVTNVVLGTVHSASSLGAPTTEADGTIRIGRDTFSGTHLVYTGTGETTDRVIDWRGDGDLTFDQSGTGLLKFTSTLVIADGDGMIILQGDTAGSGEIVGGIPNCGTLGLIKADGGTWKLSGGNLYTGKTNVNGGTLNINGTLGAGTNVVNAKAGATNFGVSQTLAVLDIGDGAVVTLCAAAPAPASEFEGGFEGGETLAAVPEPGSIGLLLAGAVAVFGRRRKTTCA